MIEKWKSLRNLTQYRNLSDGEFLIAMAEREHAMGINLEQRVEERMQSFAQDYDLAGLKANDKDVLKALILSIISLEDLELEHHELIKEKKKTEEDLSKLEKLGKIMSMYRQDISRMQKDLNINRASRQNERAENVIEELDLLKDKARQFYEQKMNYVFCPKCDMLLFTGWFLYPDERNYLKFRCGRCQEVFQVKSKDLVAGKDRKHNSNRPELMPEGVA
jgi:phage FluMu protein Com